MSLIARIFGRSGSDNGRMKLRYFEDVLPVEFDAINARRQNINPELPRRPDILKRPPIAPLEPKESAVVQPLDLASKEGGGVAPRLRDSKGGAIETRAPESEPSRKASPDPSILFPDSFGGGLSPRSLRKEDKDVEFADPKEPDYDKTRPQPVPCDATGLALSGGGIRSAAVCLGVLQALHHRRCIDSIDYLSTVSGGGYIGSSLSAAMSVPGRGKFPFGNDVFDSAAVAHLRNYSNYLLPREHSGIRNFSEAAAIILRGLLANGILVLATLLACALFTIVAYQDRAGLLKGSFLLRLFEKLPNWLPSWLQLPHNDLVETINTLPFGLTLLLVLAVSVVLIIWVCLRLFVRFDRYTDDTKSLLLTFVRFWIIATLAVAFLDLQPLAIEVFIRFYEYLTNPESGITLTQIKTFLGVLASFSAAISVLSSWLGIFLKTSQHATDWKTFALRGATKAAIFFAAIVLPLALWVVYLGLSAIGLKGWAAMGAVELLQPKEWPVFKTIIPWAQYVYDFMPTQIAWLYLIVFCVLFLICLFFGDNSYSLHRLYRDRLSKAFLFVAPYRGQVDPTPLDRLKLSELAYSEGPYHIVNAAMNVQGSAEANRRGRGADFFMFTRHFVGSDLTLYGPTKETLAETPDMECIEPRLDLATAMAISGAAVSANMGGQTIRLLSPTLALLNVRLGYWLSNPRDLAKTVTTSLGMKRFATIILGKLYLLSEMFNLLDENSRKVYLTDGGHIENLGIYELLKRGCQLIIAVDAEADPSMSFGSLLKLERYARIDLGVRILLPWEEMAARAKSYNEGIANENAVPSNGPHCAVGRIIYQNGAEGILVYFKSSLTGDEKDYILDYKKRYLSFPHETTGDQFFSEEQFEVYRALGFHIADGFFEGTDKFSFYVTGPNAFADRTAALAAVTALLPTIV
jgi:hypothetical protein